MQFANSMEKIVSSQGIFGLIQHQAKAKLDFRLFYSVELLRTRRMSQQNGGMAFSASFRSSDLFGHHQLER
jgi:hypothetical protein